MHDGLAKHRGVAPDRDAARLRGDEFAFLAPPEATADDKVCFAYVDTRKRCGHFTEYLWVDESIKPIPAMPDLDA